MRGLRSELLPFEPEIEKDNTSNLRSSESNTVSGKDLQRGNHTCFSSDNESKQEKTTMREPTAQTMGDYCKRTNAWQIYIGF